MHSVHMPVRDDAAHLVSALLVDDSPQALARIATPSHCTQLVARFGPTVPGGVDVHLLGAQQTVRRKRVGAGHRAILLRLEPGMQRAVAGAAPAALTGRVVAIEDLWGAEAGTRLRERLADAADADEAAALLQAAVVERARTSRDARVASPRLAFAIERMQMEGVADAARATGISERQLRREFHDTLGLSPKAVARLERFARALRAAQSAALPSWAAIAADAGYYDQAHLIAEFNAIAGVAPRALLAELRVATPVGWSRLSPPSPPAATATPKSPARRTPQR
ncbi:helix-turn-helix domain-containing protein [Luteimonas kalidii]|uniref:Helix-turn-helix domain-containing protein n=1 Tax=Luteimonas kalidii TaxID=3042025 RepID=A0ABT6JPL9_9GAMM|nr:helix-turn-helix domain-containing protein [Luteimonas kalidii]MDH5832423.1 helix-turn-helix domain-containing protein [Luteimonas kalidii]